MLSEYPLVMEFSGLLASNAVFQIFFYWNDPLPLSNLYKINHSKFRSLPEFPETTSMYYYFRHLHN